jgi:YesN/AraC family two-component response regulator
LLEAANGEKGIMMAVKHRPDLILMDIRPALRLGGRYGGLD